MPPLPHPSSLCAPPPRAPATPPSAPIYPSHTPRLRDIDASSRCPQPTAPSVVVVFLKPWPYTAHECLERTRKVISGALESAFFERSSKPLS
eukprot:scaffold15300_cov111-Isochrysis_galbana.AAC.2